MRGLMRLAIAGAMAATVSLSALAAVRIAREHGDAAASGAPTTTVLGLHRSHPVTASRPTRPTRATVSRFTMIDPYAPSATIAIPRLDVQAPVYERGLDSAGQPIIAPGYAVTHYRYSDPLGQPGNYVLYGHNDIEGSIFRDLSRLRAGDPIYLYRGARRFVYRVTGRAIVSPGAVYVMDSTARPTLTMISCTPYWVDTQRLIVRASLSG